MSVWMADASPSCASKGSPHVQFVFLDSKSLSVDDKRTKSSLHCTSILNLAGSTKCSSHDLFLITNETYPMMFSCDHSIFRNWDAMVFIHRIVSLGTALLDDDSIEHISGKSAIIDYIIHFNSYLIWIMFYKIHTKWFQNVCPFAVKKKTGNSDDIVWQIPLDYEQRIKS